MRPLIPLLLVGAILVDGAYWAIWFTQREWLASERTRAYYAFEGAFPLADAWLGIAALLALVTLLRRRPAALFWLVCAGSAGLYLFCMDVLYDVQHGIFRRGTAGALEALVVALTFAFSVTILVWSWRHRGQLLSPADDDDSKRRTPAP
ncbi:MAG TPA: hypothetical protein VFL69_02320 [Marmoricola sp.]|nr:hypothetical protein [Marmoricola sp.]